MKKERVNELKKNKDGKFTLIFTHSADGELNRPSTVPNRAWAIVESDHFFFIVKECQSSNRKYAEQDIGYKRFHQRDEHYRTSTEQYNHIFGEGKWDKMWMEPEDFFLFKGDKKLIMDENAALLQEESWKSSIQLMPKHSDR